jgi:uncharacterized membrane protein YoaK (UPF0700 family)
MDPTEGGDPRLPIVRVIRERYLAHPRHGPLPGLLLVLTLLTGLVDAVSILRMGQVFVANMTGNVVFVGFGIAGAAGFSIRASLTSLAGFVVGAGVSGSMPASWSSDRTQLLRTAVVIELTLTLPVMVMAGAAGVSRGRPITYVMLALLGAAMGVQNATVRRLGVPDLTTTVITMTLTGLFADLRKRGWRDPATSSRVLSLLFLFVGAVVGGTLVLEVSPTAALTFGVVLLALVGGVAQCATTRRVTWAAFPAS